MVFFYSLSLILAPKGFINLHYYIHVDNIVFTPEMENKYKGIMGNL